MAIRVPTLMVIIRVDVNGYSSSNSNGNYKS